MSAIAKSLSDIIGNTPMLALARYAAAEQLNANIIAKLEYTNPIGSVKDRIAKAMIDEGEQSGALTPGTVIVEPTSGNTGIGLAAVAASRGYKVILTMPETMSTERQKLLKAYGAELVLTEGAKGMNGAVAKAQEIAAGLPKAFIPGQFENPANPQAHRDTTGPEIWRDTAGAVDILVAGVGSGGTISGIGSFLKAQNPHVRIVAVEPQDSPVLSGGKAGAHKIQGIGAGFLPGNFDSSICDEILAVRHEDAYQTARMLVKTEGILVGISSGAAVWAAAQLAQRAENAGKMIVVILPDGGEKYLSTELFEG